MKKLNQRDVTIATYFFALCFFILALYSFFPCYFFFVSNKKQNEFITNDINNYKKILNKHQLLKQKVDTLYNQLSLLNTGKVENDLLLEKYLSDNKNEIDKIIGEDSTTEFKEYDFLMSNVNKILSLKDTLIGISNKEQLALNDLMQCMNKTRKVKKDLSFDPSRNFSSSK